MRTHFIALAAAILLAPTAFAGSVDTETDYLTETETCAFEGDGYSDGNWSETSYWYYERGSYSSQCKGSFTYASTAASDDAGEVASASAGANDAETRSQTYERAGSGYRYDEDGDGRPDSGGDARDEAASFSEGSSWERRLDVGSREGDAAVVRGCDDGYAQSHEGRSNSWWYRASPPHNETSPPDNETPPPPTPQDHGSYYGGSDRSYDRRGDWTSGCHDTASLTRDGETASVGRRDACASNGSHWERSSEQWGPDHSYASRETYSESSDACEYEAFVSADGTEASAGLGSDCTGQSSSYSSGADSWRRSWDTESCTQGLHADGPHDIHAFAGESRSNTSECQSNDTTTECWSWGDSYRYATIEWEHNPLGPSPIWIPLP